MFPDDDTPPSDNAYVSFTISERMEHEFDEESQVSTFLVDDDVQSGALSSTAKSYNLPSPREPDVVSEICCLAAARCETAHLTFASHGFPFNFVDSSTCQEESENLHLPVVLPCESVSSDAHARNAERAAHAQALAACFSRVEARQFHTSSSLSTEFPPPEPAGLCSWAQKVASSATHGAQQTSLAVLHTTQFVASSTWSLAMDPKAQATVVCAAGSAVVLGGLGGAAGTLTGGVLGASAALPAAVFTLGLSVPVGILVGSSTGLCVGTTIGGTVGFLGGGAIGYGLHSKTSDTSCGVVEASATQSGKVDMVSLAQT